MSNPEYETEFNEDNSAHILTEQLNDFIDSKHVDDGNVYSALATLLSWTIASISHHNDEKALKFISEVLIPDLITATKMYNELNRNNVTIQ